MGKIYCEMSSCVEGVRIADYEINEDVFIGENIRRDIFKVRFDADTEEVECNCRLFQFCGILCKHAITVLIRRRISQIPEKYLLKRWSKNVNRAYTRVKICYDDWSKNPGARRFQEMCNAFVEVAEMAAGSVDSYNKVMTALQELKRVLETGSCESNQIMSIMKSNDGPSCGDGSATY